MSHINRGLSTPEQNAQSLWSQVAAGSSSYHELSEQPIREVDVVEQLRANIDRLTEMHGRLSFMMSEVGQLTRSRMKS